MSGTLPGRSYKPQFDLNIGCIKGLVVISQRMLENFFH
jgi:hypothetical protein